MQKESKRKGYQVTITTSVFEVPTSSVDLTMELIIWWLLC
jgi:hypothetical protein